MTMQRGIIEFLRTQSTPVTFAEIYEHLLEEYPMHPTLLHEISKALKSLTKRQRVVKSVVGEYQTKFAVEGESMPLWGYELATP